MPSGERGAPVSTLLLNCRVSLKDNPWIRCMKMLYALPGALREQFQREALACCYGNP